MSGKSIKKNYLYNASYQLLTIITPLITTPYVSRKLGADGIGIYSFTASIAAYFIMAATLGTARYGQREISYSQNDIDRRTSAFWQTEALSCVSTLLSVIAYAVYVSHAKDNVDIYAVQIFSVIAVAADITWFFQGMEEFGRIVLRNTFFRVISIAFIFLAVRSHDDLFLYVCGLSLLTLISNLSLWPYLKGSVRRPRISDFAFWKILPEVLLLFVPTIAISVYTVLDKTMIGVITGSSFENGYYEQSLKLSRLLLTIVTSLGVVMVPRIGHHFFEGQMDAVKQYMYKSYRFVWLAGVPLCFGTCAVASNIVPWFFGDGFDKVVPLLKITSFTILAVGISNVTGTQYLIPTKRHNLFSATVIAGALVNVVLNCFLISRFASIGAAIASVAAETVIAVVQLIAVRKELSGAEIINSSWKYLLSGTIMFTVVSLAGGMLQASVINSMILIALGGAVYCAGLVLLRDGFFIAQTSNVLGSIKKRLHMLKK